MPSHSVPWAVRLSLTALFAPVAVLAAVRAQLPFGSPPSAPASASASGPGHLLTLEWEDRSALERAVAVLEREDLDVWHTARTPGRPHWHTALRVDGPRNASLEHLLQPLLRLGLPEPIAGHQLDLADHLATPGGSASHARTLSTAALAHLAASPPPGALTLSRTSPIHDTFHPYDGIHAILVALQTAYPEWVTVVSLGTSSEGRDIWGVKVTHPPTTHNDEDDPIPSPSDTASKKRHSHKRTRKLGFVVSGTQHAREWIAASTILYLVHDLVAPDGPGSKARRKLLRHVEFTFVPVVNPDGYVYSWETDRLWRKSRQPVGSPSPSAASSSGSGGTTKPCYGIDLNRNWGFEFQRGTRPNPCSDSYPGHEAFESVELQALRDYLLDEEHPVDAFLDLHSFGQMLLFPYSYSCDVQTADEENHYEAVLQAARALKDVHGRQFETGSVCEVSLTSPGMSLDWTYASAKIRWSFGAELRDAGVFGFLLPPSQIRPSGEEMSAALQSLAQFILDKEAGKR